MLASKTEMFGAEYCLASGDYSILEDVGCSVAIYNSALTFVFMYCWPTILGIIAFIYGCKFNSTSR
jgi:Pheromone A receptor